MVAPCCQQIKESVYFIGTDGHLQKHHIQWRYSRLGWINKSSRNRNVQVSSRPVQTFAMFDDFTEQVDWCAFMCCNKLSMHFKLDFLTSMWLSCRTDIWELHVKYLFPLQEEAAQGTTSVFPSECSTVIIYIFSYSITFPSDSNCAFQNWEYYGHQKSGQIYLTCTFKKCVIKLNFNVPNINILILQYLKWYFSTGGRSTQIFYLSKSSNTTV